MEVDYQHFVFLVNAFLSGGGQVIEATLKSGQSYQGAMLTIIRLGSQGEFLLSHGSLFLQRSEQVFPSHIVQPFQLLFVHFHDSIIRCSRILVFQHGGDGFIGQLHRIQCNVDLWLLDAIDELLAVLGSFRLRELGDGFLAHRLGFLVVVETRAVFSVAIVLVHQAPRNQRGNLGRKRVVLVLVLQVLHRGLVLVVLVQNEVDEAETLEVVINQHILVLLLEIVGDEVLVDLQAFRKWVVHRAQVGLHEVLGGQPPCIGLTFHIVGIGLILVVVGHAVEHELEERGFVVDILLIVVLVFVQHHEILGLGFFQCLDGLQGFIIMLVDARLETLLVPIFHLHLGDVAVDGQVFIDVPFVFVQVIGIGLGDFLVQEGVVNGI